MRLLPELILVSVVLLAVGGCRLASTSSAVLLPDDETVGRAQRSGLGVTTVSAEGFEVLLVANAAAFEAQAGRETYERLHVYLAGDGSPWVGRQIAQRPEPRNPIALQLMLRDRAPAVLLGRPCYHVTHKCNPSLWTFERYSERVVGALAKALTVVLAERDLAQNSLSVTLIGYSGGGALAVLLAQKVRAVDEVITIAAPLDTAAWAEHHGFTPLVGSLNPASLNGDLRPIRELHLQGEEDEQVPPATTAAYFSKWPSGGAPFGKFGAKSGTNIGPHATNTEEAAGQTVQRISLKKQRHQCCWARHWPLPEVERWLRARP